MTTFLAALLLFILAFCGMALGVIMKRGSLRRGCANNSGKDCCKSKR